MKNSTNLNHQEQILRFLHEAEKLKSVLRHSWLSSGRRESTAEHTWRMALMAMVLHPYLKKKPDLFKILKMVLVHDLVEVYAGDVPKWRSVKSAKIRALKFKQETGAINKLSAMLPRRQGSEIKSLWTEYEAGKSAESKFARALDRLEVKIQHQEADFKYLNKTEIRYNLIGGKKDCEYDPFLMDLWKNLSANWMKIYKQHGVDKKLYQ